MLHTWEVVRGPPRGEGIASSLRVRCSKCGLWAGAHACVSKARTLCASHWSAGKCQYDRVKHDVMRAGNAFRCQRCSLVCDASRRSATSRTFCPVPQVEWGDAVQQKAWSFWTGRTMRWLQALRLWYACRPWTEGVPVEQLYTEDHRPLQLSQWNVHWPLRHRGGFWCLRCGVSDRTKAKTLETTRCRGIAPLTEGQMIRLRQGVFSSQLRAAPDSWAIRAKELGWPG